MFPNPSREQIIADAAALEAAQVTKRCGHLASPLTGIGGLDPRDQARARAEYAAEDCRDCQRAAYRASRGR